MDLTSLAQLVLTVFSVSLLAYQENLNKFSFYTQENRGMVLQYNRIVQSHYTTAKRKKTYCALSPLV